jgi:hypothetical protein
MIDLFCLQKIKSTETCIMDSDSDSDNDHNSTSIGTNPFLEQLNALVDNDNNDTNTTNKSFLDQLNAMTDNDKISMDELNSLDTGCCPICYEKLQFLKYNSIHDEVKPNPNVVTTPCGHSFCFTCLATHMERKNKCPLCRTDICKTQKYKLISTQEGCATINQKMDMHLTYKFNNLFTASEQLRDSDILLGSVKYCMYDLMQTLRRMQVINDSDADDDM